MEREIELLKDPNRAAAEMDVTPELEKLRSENSKLKYQINHLKRVSETYETAFLRWGRRTPGLNHEIPDRVRVCGTV